MTLRIAATLLLTGCWALCGCQGETATTGAPGMLQDCAVPLVWPRSTRSVALVDDFVVHPGHATYDAIVPVMLDGRGPYPFLVDTGAEVTVISPEIAGGGAADAAEVRLEGLGGIQRVRRQTVSVVRVGGAEVRDLPLVVGEIRPTIDMAQGILGQDFLHHFNVSIDYPHRVFHLSGIPTVRDREQNYFTTRN